MFIQQHLWLYLLQLKVFLFTSTYIHSVSKTAAVRTSHCGVKYLFGEDVCFDIFFYQLTSWKGDMTVKQKCNFQDNCFGKLGKVRIADSFEFIYREKEGKDKKYMHECNHGYLHQCTLKLGNL